MADRPAIFAAPAVLSLLAGHKTQHRVLATSPLAKSKPGDRLWVRESWRIDDDVCEAWDAVAVPCIGWIQYQADGASEEVSAPSFKAVDDLARGKRQIVDWDHLPSGYRPSIHMPRWASRLTLVVEDVRFQRLHEISEADALADGVPFGCEHDPIAEIHGEKAGRTYCPKCGGYGTHGALGDGLGVIEVDCSGCDTAIKLYRNLWDSMHGDKPGQSWDDNPEVVALTFSAHRCNIDQMEGQANG